MEQKKCFNYCLWAKLVVAVPALPLVGMVAASHFYDPAVQMMAAVAAISATVAAAIWVDRIPALQKKIRHISEK